MSIRRSRTPYDQDILPDFTRAASAELQVGSDDDDEAIRGKLAERKRRKARAQEEARLAEEARLEAERQEQARLEEERARAEAEAQRIEAARKAEEARKEAESRRADALVGSSTGARPNVEVMSPRCLRCAWTNMPCLRSTDSKKKRMACNRCNELKERCRWPVEGEAGPGVGPAGDKGKGKADVTSPRAGEKKKRSRRPSAKVLEGAGDEDEDVGEGPSTSKKTGDEVEAGPVTGDQMEHLIKAVECVADNMAGLTTAQREVSRNFYRFARSYETYVEERFEFLVPDVPSDRDTTDEEDREVEGLDDELEGLREEEEESRSRSESGDQAGAGSAGSQV
ncbi:hypothetical protein M404DRAFT_23935 [Pisolithus tinctorius Marx 270]|uniref:Zn(2)-C6 fungal-type domain-containing protein n=1 Tax=Pisolithus tinctorius Marx 270 TaxID=870435 RepID=A0A0C3P315_PISTI|nr:hypothetical protein M404DRAFT_23935 [Pisolithus tinctorius Marx 270]